MIGLLLLLQGFALGQRVAVTTGYVNVRATPSATGTLLGQQPAGAQGVVTALGISTPAAGDTITRLQVTFDAPPSGWVWQYYMAPVTTPPPPPPPPPPAPPPTPPPAPPPVGWDTVVAMVAVQPASATGFLTGSSDTLRFDTVVLSAVGTIRSCGLTWTVANPAVAKVLPPSVIGLTRGTTTLTVACGAIRSHPVQVQFDTLPTPKPPAPPVFGVSDTRWLALTECPIVVATTCTRAFPIFSIVDGHTIMQVTVTAKFSAP